MCLHEDPESRVRDIAERVGITERAVLRILQELEDSDVITRERAGRRNVYSIHMDQRLRHPVEQHRTVGDLVRLIGPSRTRAGRKSA